MKKILFLIPICLVLNCVSCRKTITVGPSETIVSATNGEVKIVSENVRCEESDFGKTYFYDLVVGVASEGLIMPGGSAFNRRIRIFIGDEELSGLCLDFKRSDDLKSDSFTFACDKVGNKKLHIDLDLIKDNQYFDQITLAGELKTKASLSCSPFYLSVYNKTSTITITKHEDIDFKRIDIYCGTDEFSTNYIRFSPDEFYQDNWNNLDDGPINLEVTWLSSNTDFDVGPVTFYGAKY